MSAVRSEAGDVRSRSPLGGPIPAGIDVLRVTGSACVPTHRLIDAELMRNGKPVAQSAHCPTRRQRGGCGRPRRPSCCRPPICSPFRANSGSRVEGVEFVFTFSNDTPSGLWNFVPGPLEVAEWFGNDQPRLVAEGPQDGYLRMQLA